MKRQTTWLLLLLLGSNAAAESVWLSDLNTRLANSDWGTCKINHSFKETPLTIDGKPFEKGLGVHASSRIPIELGGQAQRFTASVGIDDVGSNKPMGSVEFIVNGDGRSIWSSGIMKQGNPAKTVDLDVTGFQFLELLVSDGGDGDSGDYANWAAAKIEYSDVAPVIAEPDALPTNLPRIVWLNYDPSGDRLVTNQFNLVVVARKGKYYLKDLAMTEESAWYTVNGTVNRKDARKLPESPFPAGRWLSINKFVADVENVNVAGTSIHYLYSKTPALAYSAMFYIDDGKPAPTLSHTEPLWPATPFGVTNPLFMAIPAFEPASNKSFSAGVPDDIKPEELTARLGWCTGPDKYFIMYMGGVIEFIKQMGVERPHGLNQFTEEELVKAADILAGMSTARFFSVDFEPGHPEKEGWMWDSNCPQAYRLSQLILEKHGRYFCSWMNEGTRFDFKGERIRIDGYATADWGGRVDDWIAFHENPAAITDVQHPCAGFNQLYIGYNSTEVNTEDSGTDGPAKWRSPMTWHLRTLDLLNFQTLVAQEKSRFLLFYWGFEDGAQGGFMTPMNRFKLPGYRGHYRGSMDRVPLPANLIRDTVVVHLCNPRMEYTYSWGNWGQTDPMGGLIYSTVNGQPEGRHIADLGAGAPLPSYEGPDSPPQPTKDSGYYGSGWDVTVIVQAHEIFARHLKGVCDGTQTRETYAFTFKRGLDAKETKATAAVWKNDTAEFARAFKHEQPWLQVWKNPKTGKRVLLFQDPFAEPFESVEFTVTIDGKSLTRKASGNNLYYEVL